MCGVVLMSNNNYIFPLKHVEDNRLLPAYKCPTGKTKLPLRAVPDGPTLSLECQLQSVPRLPTYPCA